MVRVLWVLGCKPCDQLRCITEPNADRLQLAHRKQGAYKMLMRTQPKKHVKRKLTKRRHAPIGEPKLFRLRISQWSTSGCA